MLSRTTFGCFCFAVLLCLKTNSASAGEYKMISQSGGTVVDSDGNTMNYQMPAFGGFGGYFDSSDLNGSATFSGTITTVFKWFPNQILKSSPLFTGAPPSGLNSIAPLSDEPPVFMDDPYDTPPANVLIAETCSTIYTGTPLPTGNCNNGLGNAEGVANDPEAPMPNRASFGTHYRIETGRKKMLTITCSPSMTIHSNGGDVHGVLNYGVDVHSVLITMGGVVSGSGNIGRNVAPLNAIIGQVVSAKIDVANDDNIPNEYQLSKWKWTIPGDTFAHYYLATNEVEAHILPFDKSDLYRPELTWRWKKPLPSSKVSCSATVYAPIYPASDLSLEDQSDPNAPANYLTVGSITQDKSVRVWSPYAKMVTFADSVNFFNHIASGDDAGDWISSGTEENPSMKAFCRVGTPDLFWSGKDSGHFQTTQLIKMDRRQYAFGGIGGGGVSTSEQKEMPRLVRYATLADKLGHHAQADHIYRRIIEAVSVEEGFPPLPPVPGDAATLRAVARMAQGVDTLYNANAREAVPLFRDALNKMPHSDVARFYLGYALWNDGDWRKQQYGHWQEGLHLLREVAASPDPKLSALAKARIQDLTQNAYVSPDNLRTSSVQ